MNLPAGTYDQVAEAPATWRRLVRPTLFEHWLMTADPGFQMQAIELARTVSRLAMVLPGMPDLTPV